MRIWSPPNLSRDRATPTKYYSIQSTRPPTRELFGGVGRNRRSQLRFRRPPQGPDGRIVPTFTIWRARALMIRAALRRSANGRYGRGPSALPQTLPIQTGIIRLVTLVQPKPGSSSSCSSTNGEEFIEARALQVHETPICLSASRARQVCAQLADRCQGASIAHAKSHWEADSQRTGSFPTRSCGRERSASASHGLGRAGRKHVEATCDAPRVCAELVELYGELLRARGRVG
jgi:hypothetical protein